MPFDPNAYLTESLAEMARCYRADLAALGDEGLAFSPGGVARTGFDITHEVVLVNHRVAARLRGDDPGPWPYAEGDWATAPEDIKSLDKTLALFDASIEDLQKSLPDANQDVQMATKVHSAFEVASHALTHMEYHLAQLNYLQAIRGDAQEHWS